MPTRFLPPYHAFGETEIPPGNVSIGKATVVEFVGVDDMVYVKVYRDGTLAIVNNPLYAVD
jgi:hypothetical protein